MSTLQADAAQMLDRVDAAEAERRAGKLAPEDRAMILRLAAKGNITQAEIAKAIGCDQSTVSRVLALLDTRKEARAILESGAARLADTVVKTDDAGIALKALGKLDVVREDREGSGAHIGPIVVLGSGSSVLGGFKPGDTITVDVPVCILDAEREPWVAVLRPCDASGGTFMRFPLPAETDFATLPDGVTITDEAKQILAGAGITPAAAVVREANVQVLIGTPPPGTPPNPLPVSGRRDVNE
jgi:hypothetical protein